MSPTTDISKAAMSNIPYRESSHHIPSGDRARCQSAGPILQKLWGATLEGCQENSQVSCVYAKTRTMLFFYFSFLVEFGGIRRIFILTWGVFLQIHF
jgi:hypothetical protein